MKKLVLSAHLQTKLDRLKKKAGELQYLGSDLSTLENQRIVAIVGTRKPTPYGKTVTEQLAEGLARAGVSVISGNAMGVDVIAQKAALGAGGRVVAVVPSGLDNIYPATNRPHAKAVIENGGTVISEFEAGHVPTRYDFLHRNRIIAALSDLVLIPEAAEKSGSLNTAKHALEMKIPIGAVPGPVTSNLSSGTNKLLKDGAHVIRNADDVLELLGMDKAQQTSLNLQGASPAESAILKAISEGIVEPYEIQIRAGISTTDFQIAVTVLEVQGRLTSTSVGTLRLL